MLTPSDAGRAHPCPRSGISYQEAYVQDIPQKNSYPNPRVSCGGSLAPG